MKPILYLSIAVSFLSIFIGGNYYTGKLKSENKRLKENQEILLSQKEALNSEINSYKIADSLNAIRVSQLNLTLKEYEAHRAKDLKLINELKTKGSDLQKVISTQSESISKLSLALRDTIKITDGKADTLKAFSHNSKWNEVSGIIDLKSDSLSYLQIVNKEELKIVEECKYKRFLGFLWKTSKVKSRHVSVVSLNPNTKIRSCEFISIVR